MTAAYSGDYAVAPGEYLVEWIEENQQSPVDTALRLRWSQRLLGEFIKGDLPVTDEMAEALEQVTTIPARIWLSYEARYQADNARLGTEKSQAVSPDDLPPTSDPEPLTTRLARLGASLRDNVNKVLVAEAVERIHEAEIEVAARVPVAAEKTAGGEDTSWVARYHRHVLDFVGGSADVDLATVSIASGYEAPYQYSEYTGGGGYFAINVSWKDTHPLEPSKFATGPSLERPDEDGLYPRYVQLTNDEVAKFLSSLDSA